MKRRRRKGLLPFVYTSAMALCSLPQNQTELLCTPSMDFVKQARLSLSQCLTPWPSTTHNPLERPVNHPPQVIRILNPPLTDLHPSLFHTFVLLLFRLRLLWKGFFSVDDETASVTPIFRTCVMRWTQTHYGGGSELASWDRTRICVQCSDVIYRGLICRRFPLSSSFCLSLFTPSYIRTCLLFPATWGFHVLVCTNKQEDNIYRACLVLKCAYDSWLDLKCLYCTLPHTLELSKYTHTHTPFMFFVLSGSHWGQDHTLLYTLSLGWSWAGRASLRGSCFKMGDGYCSSGF